MASTYTKTAKGAEEVGTRAHRLTPRQRSLLILVNGQRPDDELRQALGNAFEETMAALLQGGFVERRSAAPTPVTAPPAPAAAPAPAAKPGTLSPAARQLARLAGNALIDIVGPMGEALAMRMERASTEAELSALIDTASTTIANTRGARAANDFIARFRVQ